MTRREMAAAWMFSLVYTAYAVGVIALAVDLVSGWLGGALGLAAALGPIIGWTFWEVGR